MGNTPPRMGRSQKKKSTKKKPDSWFETCTVPQLKDLCKSCKLPVSGTKLELCHRLMLHDVASNYGNERQAYLKHLCKEKLLVQSGNKYDQVLRLLHHEFGTGVAKRAATETIVDDTGKEVEVLKKKRKSTPSPKTMYTRVAKKMNAVTQQKYQSNYGSKGHSGDVYGLMREFMKDCVDSKTVENDPLLAVEMGMSVFGAFNDNWHVMVRPGYETYLFIDAVDMFADILKASRENLDEDQIEKVVSLLESIEASVSGYSIHERYVSGCADPSKAGENNVLKQAILAVSPDYDESNRDKKKGKLLDYEVKSICWLNGITPPNWTRRS